MQPLGKWEEFTFSFWIYVETEMQLKGIQKITKRKIISTRANKTMLKEGKVVDKYSIIPNNKRNKLVFTVKNRKNTTS